MTDLKTPMGVPAVSASGGQHPKTISARDIKINRDQPQGDQHAVADSCPTNVLIPSGFLPIPVDASGRTAIVDQTQWSEDFSIERLEDYRQAHPDAQFAFIVPDGVIVVGTERVETQKPLWDRFQKTGLAPLVRIHCGEERWYPLKLDAAALLSLPQSSGHQGDQPIVMLFPGDLMPFRSDTKIAIAAGITRDDWHEVDAEALAEFRRYNREAADVALAQQEDQAFHPLKTFAINSETLKDQINEATEVLPGIALRGQTTVIFAPPNTGKTLLIFYLLIQAIKAGLLSAQHVFYLNVDDNVQGLYDKALLAERYGFHMLAEGFEGFQVKLFMGKIRTLIDTGLAPRTVIVLDTLKRFTDVMDKRANTEFTGLMRQFAVKGGTVIQLGHTNKNRGLNGKATFAGTSDLVDDVDCAYMLDEIKADREAQRKIVEFRRLKSRGSVSEAAAFSYSIADGMAYSELLASVEELDPASLEPILHELSMERDQPVIDAIEDMIRSGSNAKTQIVTGVARTTKVGQRGVAKVLDRYTGESPGQHRWTYIVGPRGARLYTLLPPPADLEEA